MSGMTRSMPNISSSGNISPQSITTMSSPYSNRYMFLPISPTPPRGMIRSGRFGSGIVRCLVGRSEERQLAGRVGQVAGDGGVQRSLDLGDQLPFLGARRVHDR